MKFKTKFILSAFNGEYAAAVVVVVDDDDDDDDVNGGNDRLNVIMCRRWWITLRDDTPAEYIP